MSSEELPHLEATIPFITTERYGIMGGRGANSGKSTKTIGTIGGGSMASVQQQQSAGGVRMQMQQQPPKTAATPQQAAAANNQAFAATDSSPYHQLYNGRQYYQAQNLTVSQQMAAMDYIDPDPTPGSLYSASQNLNTAMLNGSKLTAQQAYTKNMLESSMHNLGYNLSLTRYDHSAWLNGLLSGTGLNMNTATVAQLQKALITGKPFYENRFLSTSYNDFKNAPASDPFRDRQVKIVFKAKASTQAMMPGDTYDKSGKKLSWGEMLLAPNAKQKIVGVRELSKNGGRPKGTPPGTKGLRQIEVTVEVE